MSNTSYILVLLNCDDGAQEAEERDSEGDGFLSRSRGGKISEYYHAARLNEDQG